MTFFNPVAEFMGHILHTEHSRIPLGRGEGERESQEVHGECVPQHQGPLQNAQLQSPDGCLHPWCSTCR
jgi:hypothetical protein